MTRTQLDKILLAKPQTWLDYPFGEGTAVYKVGQAGDETGAKMFAIVAENKSPLQISLKCDPLLADTLRQKYNTVMPGYHLNKKHWNTIVLSGELPDEEIEALITLSYNLVTS